MKPTDKAILGMVSKSPGRNKSEPWLRFQFPPPRTQRADFPHYALLHTSCQSLWDLFTWRDYRARLSVSHPVLTKEPQCPVQPSPAPSLPPKSLALTGSAQMAPDLLFHPVSDVRETAARMADRKVLHPAA